jgi:hypothetical protein
LVVVLAVRVPLRATLTPAMPAPLAAFVIEPEML